MRAPLAPIAWPIATAPPFTFTFSGFSLSWRVTAIAATAKASFSSTRSTSLSRSQPVFLRSFSTASTGAIITHFGSTPLTACATKWVMMAPVDAVEKLLKKTGWDRDKDVDLVELNEAFAVAAIAVTRKLKLNPEKVNVNGGAVALGHPIGASGARILVTLLYELQRRNLKRGIAALCLGGGNAVALAVERF